MTATTRLAAKIAAGALVAAGTGVGLAYAVASSSNISPGYAYYSSQLSQSGNYQMISRQAYAWMTGGRTAPGWERGSDLPSFMMGWTAHHPGEYIGWLFADAPGRSVTASGASQMGAEVPQGAAVDTSANRISFSDREVRFAVVASPSMPAEYLRIAGLTDHTVVVPVGATVHITVINADDDMAHGLVVTSEGALSWMPMMASSPAFSGSALWFLADASSSGMHEGALSFTASAPGTYQHLCPVPGHARAGMAGTFVVEETP